MTDYPPTHIKRIEQSALRPDITTLDATPTPVAMYMVVGKARNLTQEGTRLCLVGEFEAYVLGKAGVWQSRECLLGTDYCSKVIADHVLRVQYDGGYYEVGLVLMRHADRVYPVIRHLQCIDIA